jgi:hypothetical protein
MLLNDLYMIFPTINPGICIKLLKALTKFRKETYLTNSAVHGHIVNFPHITIYIEIKEMGSDIVILKNNITTSKYLNDFLNYILIDLKYNSRVYKGSVNYKHNFINQPFAP